MKIKKKIIVITAGGLAVLGAGAWFLTQNLRGAQIDVYPVSELSQSIWQNGASLEGTIASQVAQEVHLQEKQIVSAVHVQEGQEVKKGDPLLSYDMTLVDIELETEKLSRQQLEIKKKGLEQELEKLKKDRAEAVSHTEEYQVEFLGGLQSETPFVREISGEEGAPLEPETPAEPEAPAEPELPAEPEVPVEPETPAEPETPLEPESPTEPEMPLEPEIPVEPGNPEEPDIPLVPDNPEDQDPSGETDPSGDNETPQEPEEPQEPEQPRPSGVYKRLYGDIGINFGELEEGVILENALPFAGSGTKEDPYRFLCSKNVLIQGAFLNWAGGFSDTGEKNQTPYYCLLEVRGEDKEDGVLLAAMLLDGNLIAEPVQPEIWYRTYLGNDQWEAVLPPEEEIPQDEEWVDIPEDFIEFIPEEEIVQTYSKEELDKAVKEKEKEISETALNIKEADLKIKKVEQQLQEQVVKSTLDGTVKKVGDPAKGEVDGEAFIIVESAAGAYIQGMVGEYQRSILEPGQIVTGMGYESQMFFQAEVTEISPYPQEGYSSGMQEQSYYPFTAVIQEGEGFKANEMVSIELPAEGGEITGIFVSREYIRSQNGEEFVYKVGENQRLKKQKITTGRTFYGSTVEIKDGVTQEDWLAFPYGKNVREGAKIRESSIEELYSMY